MDIMIRTLDLNNTEIQLTNADKRTVRVVVRQERGVIVEFPLDIWDQDEMIEGLKVLRRLNDE